MDTNDYTKTDCFLGNHLFNRVKVVANLDNGGPNLDKMTIN